MIRLDRISFGYRREHKLFDGLSLELTPGHIHGLLGANGTGKSTLLKLASGLLFPQQGEAFIDGLDASRRGVDFYGKLFFVPEEFALPAIRLGRYVAVNAVFYPGFSEEQFGYYLREFSLEPRMRLDRLSMGQKKRALLAFAMACNTPVLLLDEPTNGLDIPSKRVFRRLLAGYADEGRTVVVSTHQIRDIEEMIDNVVILDSKGVVLAETTETLTQKLWFGQVGAADRPVYTEDRLPGRVGIVPNDAGRDSKSDLELLFNASIHAREALRELLNR